MDIKMTEWEFLIKNGPTSCGLEALKEELTKSKRPITIKNVFEIPGLHCETIELDRLDRNPNREEEFTFYGKMDISLDNATPSYSKMDKREVIIRYNATSKEGKVDVLVAPSYVAKYFI